MTENEFLNYQLAIKKFLNGSNTFLSKFANTIVSKY